MKKTLIPTLAVMAFLSLYSCKEKKTSPDNWPVVAHKVNDLTTLDYSLIKDTFDFPISSLFSSFEIIRLENSDKALVASSGSYSVSENYVGMETSIGNSSYYKVFDKQGNYISSLSSKGQGPDEFLYGLCDSYIDEKEEKVYLLSYSAKKLLVFDLSGNPLEHIPFPFMVPKGRFIVNEEKRELIMMALPFHDTPFAIWKQDFNGKVLQSIDSDLFISGNNDYGSEVNWSLNTSQIDYSLFHWIPTQDSLYHYNEHDNGITPVFTVKWRKEEAIPHNYIELSDYYYVVIVTGPATFTSTPTYPRILIDKNSLRGCFVNLKLDMLGNITAPVTTTFIRGYCIVNFYPHELKAQLKRAMASTGYLDLDDNTKKRIISLCNEIDEEDNRILLVGKLK